MPRCKKTTQRRSGHSLLELIAASTLTSILIVSTLNLMRESMELGRDVEARSLVSTLAVSVMERHLGDVSDGWVEGTFVGDFSADGYPNIRFVVTRSDDSSAGGIQDELMAVTTTAWSDTNGNNSMDSGEPRVIYASKVADLTAWDPGERSK